MGLARDNVRGYDPELGGNPFRDVLHDGVMGLVGSEVVILPIKRLLQRQVEGEGGDSMNIFFGSRLNDGWCQLQAHGTLLSLRTGDPKQIQTRNIGIDSVLYSHPHRGIKF